MNTPAINYYYEFPRKLGLDPRLIKTEATQIRMIWDMCSFGIIKVQIQRKPIPDWFMRKGFVSDEVTFTISPTH